MKRDIKKILEAYLEAALWTSEDDLKNKKISIYNIAKKSKEDATKIIKSFLKQALLLLTVEWADEQIGHDLWLTRGGHGAGVLG